jgi:hypothetical protein
MSVSTSCRLFDYVVQIVSLDWLIAIAHSHLAMGGRAKSLDTSYRSRLIIIQVE